MEVKAGAFAFNVGISLEINKSGEVEPSVEVSPSWEKRNDKQNENKCLSRKLQTPILIIPEHFSIHFWHAFWSNEDEFSEQLTQMILKKKKKIKLG